MRNEKGFTLLEMLVVIAIIAVLVAIAIPVFTSQVAAAREATCQANERSLEAAVSAAYMSNGGDKQAAAKEGVSSMGLDPNTLIGSDSRFTIQAGSLCPKDGVFTITFNEGSISVTCSVHGNELLGQNQETMNTIGSIFRDLPLADSAGSYPGSAGTTDYVLAELKKAGIDLEAMGAASWQWRPEGTYPKLYWSSVDINTPDMLGKTIPVMSYTPDTGKYLVYTTAVVERLESGTGIANGYAYAASKKQITKEGLTYSDAYLEFMKQMDLYNQQQG